MLPENPMFLIRGEDGEEYGPVDLAELRDWVAENRAGIGTDVKRDDPHATWQPWQNFPELVALLAEVNATGGELIAPDVVFAPMWRRLLAFVIDYFLASLLSVPLVYVLEAVSGIRNLELRYILAVLQPDLPAPPNLLFYGNLSNIISLLILVFYFAGFIAAHGRTPAKSILRMRVITLDGEKPSFVKALARSIALVLSANMLFFLPMLYAFFNPQRRTLHDMIAGTFVIEV
jgi:uncharacterized RDD family membrane protein YckC